MKQGVDTTFIATEDAFVSSDAAGSNYGSSLELHAYDAVADRHSYLKFNVSGLSGTVVAARLRCYTTPSGGSADGPDVAETDADWAEATLTWANKPAHTGVFASLGNAPASAWVEWDVSAAVSTDGVYSFALIPSSADGMYCSSSEAATNRPQLVVTTSPVATPTTYTFNTNADTHAGPAAPDTNHSAEPLASVDWSSSGASTFTSYFRFTVNGLPPGATISSARLRLFVTNPSASSSSKNVYLANPANVAWYESTLDWNNRPSRGATVLATTGESEDETWEELAVSGITGNGNYTFVLEAPVNANDSTGFATKEYVHTDGSRKVPQLVLTVEPGTGDTTAPVISVEPVSGISSTGATVSWSTNEPSDSTVEYGLTTAYGAALTDADLTTEHAMMLSGLSGGTVYHYRVKSRDAAGNVAVSADQTFATNDVVDTVPPTISGLTESVTSTSATITWTTDEAADTQLRYGKTTSYELGYTPLADTSPRTTSHSVTLSGLSPGTVYYYCPRAHDAAGNSAACVQHGFTTSPGTASGLQCPASHPSELFRDDFNSGLSSAWRVMDQQRDGKGPFTNVTNYLTENVTVSGGLLRVSARRHCTDPWVDSSAPESPASCAGTNYYSGGWLKGPHHAAGQGLMLFHARMPESDLPRNKGLFPALWARNTETSSLSAPSSYYGELDLIETWWDTVTYGSVASDDSWRSTTHLFRPNSPEHRKTTDTLFTSSTNVPGGFRLWEVEWDAEASTPFVQYRYRDSVTATPVVTKTVTPTSPGVNGIAVSDFRRILRSNGGAGWSPYINAASYPSNDAFHVGANSNSYYDPEDVLVDAVLICGKEDSAPPQCPAFGAVTTVGNPGICENSGLVASRRNAGILWTHEDSGHGESFFAIRASDGRKIAEYRVSTSAQGDWEDIAIARAPGCTSDSCTHYLYIGNVGSSATNKSIIRVVEPVVSCGSPPCVHTVPSSDILRMPVTLPSGTSDIEAMLADTNGDLWFINKNGTTETKRVLKYPAASHSASSRQLTEVGTLEFPMDGSNVNDYKVTAMDLSRDGMEVLVHTYTKTLYWRRSTPGQDLFNVLSGQRCDLSKGSATSSEAIAWSTTANGYWTIGDGQACSGSTPSLKWVPRTAGQ